MEMYLAAYVRVMKDVQGSASWVLDGALEKLDLFDRPAVPGRAAIPASGGRGRGRGVSAVAAVPPISAVSGPAELRWLTYTRCTDFYVANADLPLMGLLRLWALLPDRGLASARSDQL